jgi:phosphoglycolate phosphatase
VSDGATIKGILFDKDGTLLDYYATWMPVNLAAALAASRGDRRLAERLLAAGGFDPKSGRIAAGSPLAAGGTREIATVFAAHLPGRTVDSLVPEIDAIFIEGGREQGVAVPGLTATMRRLKARGLKLGVATSDSEAGAHGSLAPFQVLEMMDFIAGYDSGFGVKPHPGALEGFCRATGLIAREVAVVGDNLHDLQMGRAGGSGLVVGVLTGTSERHELAPHADHVLHSIADLEALLKFLV